MASTDRTCDHCCSNRAVVLRRSLARNGVDHFLWYCERCERNAKRAGMWIPHRTIEAWVRAGRLPSTDVIPYVADYTNEDTCAVCGDPAVEWHHWAPRALAEFFGDDWSRWPQESLCREHHIQWHSILTWWLPGETDPELAAAVRDKFMREGLYS